VVAESTIAIIQRYLMELQTHGIPVHSAVLYGSFASDEQRAESDIDLALMLEAGAKLSSTERLKIANDLAYKLERTVDLGEISSANLVYSTEAFLTGVPVFQRNPERAALRRAALMGMYIQFNLDRKEVLDAYRAR